MKDNIFNYIEKNKDSKKTLFIIYNNNIRREYSYSDLYNLVKNYSKKLKKYNFENKICKLNVGNSIESIVIFLACLKNNTSIVLDYNDKGKSSINDFYYIFNNKLEIDYNKINHFANNNTETLIGLYTSGTKGKPKIIKHKEEDIINQIINIDGPKYGYNNRILIPTSFAAISCYRHSIINSIILGNVTCLFDFKDNIIERINDYYSLLIDERINFTFIPKSFIDYSIKYKEKSKISKCFDNLKYIILSGDMIFPNDVENLKNNLNLKSIDPIEIIYGATEALGPITSNKGKEIKKKYINITSIANNKINLKKHMLFKNSKYIKILSSGIQNQNIQIDNGKKAGEILYINNKNKIHLKDEGLFDNNILYIISKELKSNNFNNIEYLLEQYIYNVYGLQSVVIMNEFKNVKICFIRSYIDYESKPDYSELVYSITHNKIFSKIKIDNIYIINKDIIKYTENTNKIKKNILKENIKCFDKKEKFLKERNYDIQVLKKKNELKFCRLYLLGFINMKNNRLPTDELMKGAMFKINTITKFEKMANKNKLVNYIYDRYFLSISNPLTNFLGLDKRKINNHLTLDMLKLIKKRENTDRPIASASKYVNHEYVGNDYVYITKHFLYYGNELMNNSSSITYSIRDYDVLYDENNKIKRR